MFTRANSANVLLHKLPQRHTWQYVIAAHALRHAAATLASGERPYRNCGDWVVANSTPSSPWTYS